MASSSNPGPGFGFPPPDTGNFLLNWISRAMVGAIRIERRFDPFFRPAADKVFRDPLSRFVTALINKRRILNVPNHLKGFKQRQTRRQWKGSALKLGETHSPPGPITILAWHWPKRVI